MTPKEKASELIAKCDIKHLSALGGKRNLPVSMYRDQILKAALVVAEEVIEQWEYIDTYLDFGGKKPLSLRFWYEVKKEIEFRIKVDKL